MRKEQICPFAELINPSITRVCLIHTTRGSEGKSALWEATLFEVGKNSLRALRKTFPFDAEESRRKDGDQRWRCPWPIRHHHYDSTVKVNVIMCVLSLMLLFSSLNSEMITINSNDCHCDFVHRASPQHILHHFPINLLHFPINLLHFPIKFASFTQQIASFPQQFASFLQPVFHFPMLCMLCHFAK